MDTNVKSLVNIMLTMMEQQITGLRQIINGGSKEASPPTPDNTGHHDSPYLTEQEEKQAMAQLGIDPRVLEMGRKMQQQVLDSALNTDFNQNEEFPPIGGETYNPEPDPTPPYPLAPTKQVPLPPMKPVIPPYSMTPPYSMAPEQARQILESNIPPLGFEAPIQHIVHQPSQIQYRTVAITPEEAGQLGLPPGTTTTRVPLAPQPRMEEANNRPTRGTIDGARVLSQQFNSMIGNM